MNLYGEYSRTCDLSRILSSLNLREMTCAQLRTKTSISATRKKCYGKLGFQILYAVEQFSSLFSS